MLSSSHLYFSRQESAPPLLPAHPRRAYCRRILHNISQQCYRPAWQGCSHDSRETDFSSEEVRNILSCRIEGLLEVVLELRRLDEEEVRFLLEQFLG